MKNVMIRVLVVVLVNSSCIKNALFDTPQSNCPENLEANVNYDQVKDLYVDRTVQIMEDWVIEGYIISSDKAGNFFNVLHFQDHHIQPTNGLQLEIDLRDSHVFYPLGSKIFIKLKGLYLDKSGPVFKLGGTFNAFGNISVGRLPAAVLDEHIIRTCDEVNEPSPTWVTPDSLSENLVNTLVAFKDMEFLEEELGLPFANEDEETERTLVNCNDEDVVLLNSGFSDFSSAILPEGNGSIVGVLVKEKSDFQLIIREPGDIDFEEERCADLIDEFTSTQIFISEIADPDNNSGARFVELYNSSTEPLSLKGWKLHRYTNANADISSSLDLSDLVIAGESTLVISPNLQEFETVYGFVPDLAVRTNSPADSNGDDNLELVDPFGNVIDVFGVIGTDGSGTNHEFEDGRAFRNPNVMEGNPLYTFIEWTVYNDSGEMGTIDRPQNAPEDFSPGLRD